MDFIVCRLRQVLYILRRDGAVSNKPGTFAGSGLWMYP